MFHPIDGLGDPARAFTCLPVSGGSYHCAVSGGLEMLFHQKMLWFVLSRPDGSSFTVRLLPPDFQR